MINLIRFYWSMILRRAWMLISVVVVCVAVAAVSALNTPSSYTSTARLLVEAPQIPDNLAASTVVTDASEDFQVIRERLLRRANLIDLANKHDVFGERSSEMVPDRIVEAMSRALDVRWSARRNQATFVDVSFTNSNPEIAADVVNDLITQILEDNVRMRTQRAGSTLQFFEQEVDRLSEELALQSARISDFKAKNSETLPESLNFRLARQGSLDERLNALERELAGLEEQRQRVTAVYQGTGQVNMSEDQMTAEQRQLRALESELASALAIYSETNPRVQVLRTRVEQLRNVVAGQDVSEDGEVPTSSVYAVTLAEIDTRAASIKDQIESVTEELTELRDRIGRTPQTAIALDGLTRDYNNVQNQYNEAVRRLASARTGEQIELTAQGQRITVVENAVPPEFPTSPNRKLIAAAGGMTGLGAAAGLFALLEILNTTIRRPAELVSKVGVTPLTTIPPIRTRQQKFWQRFTWGAALLVVFVLLPAAVYVFHSNVMPLEEAYEWAKAAVRGELG